jgi:hypothetical protein
VSDALGVFWIEMVAGCCEKAVSLDCGTKVGQVVRATNVKNTFFPAELFLLFCTLLTTWLEPQYRI